MRVCRCDGSERLLDGSLLGAADQKTNNTKSYCQVKAFHTPNTAPLDSIELPPGKYLFPETKYLTRGDTPYFAAGRGPVKRLFAWKDPSYNAGSASP